MRREPTNRTFFSNILTLDQLCQLFRKEFRIRDADPQLPLPTIQLATALFGSGLRGELASVAETYNGCFTKLQDPPLCPHPACLSSLLTLMQHCHRTGASQFGYEAGKLFVTYLLNLSFEVGEACVVHPSTTTDSRTAPRLLSQ